MSGAQDVLACRPPADLGAGSWIRKDAQLAGIAYHRAIARMGDVSVFCPELPAHLAKNVVAIAIAHAAQDGLTDLDALTHVGIRALAREMGRHFKRGHGRRRNAPSRPPKMPPQKAA